MFVLTDCFIFLESDANENVNIMKLIRWDCPASFHDTKCAVMRMSEIQEWLHRHKKYRILVTGKMGSGKTTFIRGLTEEFVPSADDSLLPHTMKVLPYNKYREGSNVIFFDTPGLKDDEDSSNDYTYLKEMIRKNGEPNLLVFAIKMDVFDFQKEDADAILNVSSAFGRKIWHKSMFILTFANMVKKIGPSSVESKLYFSKLLDKHHLRILEVLRDNSVKDEVINEIPVVPVGLISEPNLAAHKNSASWIEDFWEEAFKVLRKSGPASAVFDYSENENDKLIDVKEEEEEEVKSVRDQLFGLVYYVLFITLSGFCVIRCFYRAKAILGDKWSEIIFVLLCFWCILSSGVTLYYCFEQLRENKEETANEELSYSSIFLSLSYSTWFVFTSGYTVLVLLLIGTEVDKKVPKRWLFSRIFMVLFFTWIILTSGYMVNTIFEFLTTIPNEEKSDGSPFLTVFLKTAHYSWSIFTFLFSYYELYHLDYKFLYAQVME